jgi:hypothetical protein
MNDQAILKLIGTKIFIAVILNTRSVFGSDISIIGKTNKRISAPKGTIIVGFLFKTYMFKKYK